ncbi:hypothetical protein SRHO_G00099540 [Serrasalmus rhombeus]
MMLTTNNGILHLKISPETFTTYFNAHNLKRTLEDELEEHFLSQSHVSVTFDDENQMTENGMEAGGNRLESDGASGDGHHHTQHLQHESTFCTED